jgi:hypothetical protein
VSFGAVLPLYTGWDRFESSRAGRSSRRAASGAAEPIERSTTETGERRSAVAAAAVRTGGASVGWQTAVGAYRTGVRRDPGSAAVPAFVPPVRVSPPQTSTTDRPCGPAPASRRKTNCAGSPPTHALTFGPWMRCISSSMARAAACGCRQRTASPFCRTTPRGAAWAIWRRALAGREVSVPARDGTIRRPDLL